MILYVGVFVFDPVVRFFLSFFYFFLFFEMFLVLVCLIFEGLRFAVGLFFDFVPFVDCFEPCVNL